MGDWKPEVHENVNGRNVYFWIVPAKVGGNWHDRGREQDDVSISTRNISSSPARPISAARPVDITDGSINGADISFKMDGKTYHRQGRRQHHHRREMEGHEGLELLSPAFAYDNTMKGRSLRSVLLSIDAARRTILMTTQNRRRSAREPFRGRRRPDDGRHHHRHRHFQDAADRGASTCRTMSGSSAPGCWAVSAP